MTIKQLKIQNLRNIAEADVQFSDGINFVTGKNGSGKSTLLEAIYMLGRGRSYRTAKFGPVVRHGEKFLTLYAVSSLEREHRIGIQKSATQTSIRVDGENATRLSSIAKMTPLQILTPMSHEILERGPEYRRRFLEWGVFHVEPSYFTVYKKFTKALKQRNIVLKNAPDTVASWNHTLGTLGEELNKLREKYFTDLQIALANELRALDIQGNIQMFWKRGWEDGSRLEQVLGDKEPSDIRQGYTQAGPQRADIKLMFDQRSAFTSISRGQQKMIITSLHLAQAAITKRFTGNHPILLFDDLVAELDVDNRDKLLQRIKQIGCQALITTTEEISNERYPGCVIIRVDSGDIRTTNL